MNISNINSLPPELLFEIFSKLPTKDLGNASKVCNQWNEFLKDDQAWRNIQLYSYPTPSPIKYYTVSIIRNEAIPLLNKMKEIPKDLPDYNTEVVLSECSKPETWNRCLKIPLTAILRSPQIKVDNSQGVFEFLRIVTHIFNMCIKFSKIGLTSLEQAEDVAIKTKETFHNPYPFRILEEEYNKKGNYLKAAEMGKLALDYENPY